MKIPYFSLYPADIEAKTSHLNLEEDGVFNRLLRLLWMTPGCSLPDDPTWLARRLRIDADTFDRVAAPIIDEFFKRANGRIFNQSLRDDFEKLSETYRKRSEAGKKGGRPQSIEKQQKEQKAGLSREKAGPKQPEPEPEPERIVVAAVRACPPDAPEKQGPELFDRVVKAAGVDGRLGAYWMPPAAIIHVNRWSTELGLTDDQILETVRQCRAQHADPPTGPRAFDAAMKRMAAVVRAEPMQPETQRISANDRKAAFGTAFHAAVDAIPPGATVTDFASRDPFARR